MTAAETSQGELEQARAADVAPPDSYAHIAYLKRFRVLAYALVLLAVAGFCYAEANFALFFIALVASGLSWWLVEARNARPLPRWLINVGVLFASFLLFIELVYIEQTNLLLGLGHFMVAILLCKLFETKGSRDYAQILTLSLLIMVTGAYFTQHLVFGLLLGAYLALGLYAVLVFHLRFDTERALAGGSAPAEAAMSADHQRDLRANMRRTAFRVGAVLLVFAIGVFVLFPRNKGRDIFGNWTLNSGAARTGFSDRMRFGTIGRIAQSDAIAFEVRLEQDGSNVGSEYNQLYFRGLTFERYDTGQSAWVHDDQTEMALAPAAPTGERLLIPEHEYSPRNLLVQRYTQHIGTGHVLFSAAPLGAVSPAVRFRSEGFAAGVTLSPASFTLRTVAPLRHNDLPAHYEVTSAAVYKPPALPPAYITPGSLDRAGTTPRDPTINMMPPRQVHPRTVEIAEREGAPLFALVRDRQATPEQVRALAERYATFLRTNYPYTLEYHHRDRELDPTTDFLVNRQKTGGHCEYFSSGLVMLCRAAGINARVVTGYHGGDYNSVGGFYTVRQKHAHAWAEIMVPERGWLTLDATPLATEAGPAATSEWLKRVQEFMEVVQRNWRDRVMLFDASTRRYILDNISGFFSSISGWTRRTASDAWSGLNELLFSRNSTWTARASVSLGAIFLVAGSTWLAARWRRRRRSHVAQIIRSLDAKTQRQLEIELSFFDDLLALLARTGTPKRAELTPREYVEELAPGLNGASRPALFLVDTFYAIRFGLTRMTPALQESVTSALAELRAATRT